jgi:hypothetical protein
MSFLQKCVQCKHFRPIEDRVGKCKLFGNITIARMNEYLCGKDAKLFKPSAPDPSLKNFGAPEILF